MVMRWWKPYAWALAGTLGGLGAACSSAATPATTSTPPPSDAGHADASDGSDASAGAGATDASADVGSPVDGGPKEAGDGAPPAVPSDPEGVPALRASALVDGIGINTHLDFAGYKTIGTPAIEKAIAYVGSGSLAILRDSPADDADLTLWRQIAADTGVKFDAFLGQGAPSIYRDDLTRAQAMVASGAGYVFALEGGNEEDDDFATQQGNSVQQAAMFQPTLWNAGAVAGLPVFQLSFGAGWSNPTGDYGTVGDLSAYATYGNAHTYPPSTPASAIGTLMADAALTSPGRLIAHTEFGWNAFAAGGSHDGDGWCSEVACAAYDVSFVLDAFVAGAPYYFRYELFDDRALESANAWGLFYDDGTPKASATALRVLFQLLGDGGELAQSFAPGKLEVTVSGLPAGSGASEGNGGHQLLLQKADGTFWLAIWNEQTLTDVANGNRDVSVAAVPVTVTLGHAARALALYDLLAGTSAPSLTDTATASFSFALPAHPVLLEIIE